MTGGHYITVYSCGHVQSQCRCADPSKVKTTLHYPCPTCAKNPQVAVGPVVKLPGTRSS